MRLLCFARRPVLEEEGLAQTANRLPCNNRIILTHYSGSASVACSTSTQSINQLQHVCRLPAAGCTDLANRPPADCPDFHSLFSPVGFAPGLVSPPCNLGTVRWSKHGPAAPLSGSHPGRGGMAGSRGCRTPLDCVHHARSSYFSLSARMRRLPGNVRRVCALLHSR